MNNLNSENFDDLTFQKFCKFIYKKTGIVVSDNKKSHLSNRLRSRIRSLRLESFESYWNYLQENESNSSELYELFDSVSTNETYFQRSVSHFKILENFVLPELYQKNISDISIWSAGSSTGEESYDLAMIALEFEKTHPNASIYITGTDISHRAIEIARIAEYADRRIDKLSPYMTRQYFDEIRPEKSTLPYGKTVLRAKNNLKNKVSFHYLNLINDSYLKNVDIIFCRNVLIYFDRETQTEIIDNFSRSLNPGGYLFIGHSESLQIIPNNLKIIKRPEGNIYLKE